MKPVLATVVRSSPAVCKPYAAASSAPTPTPATTPRPRERAQRAPRERGEHEGRDREPHGEEREQRIQRDRVLHLDERDAPDRGDADEGEERAGPAHRADSLRCVAMATTDTLGRPVRDLRISVTDRCNFRCVYCMPKEVFGHDYRFLPRRELLTFEEIERVARVVRRARACTSSGSPVASRSCAAISSAWSQRLAAIDDGLDVTLTTNAALLAQKAQALADAGLSRITVSLDSLDDEVFRAMNDVDFPVARVLAGIDAAAAAGLPVKVNVVVKRGPERGLDPRHRTTVPRDRARRSLHRVHGRRRDERLAARRRRARCRDRRRRSARSSRSSRSSPRTAARSPSATATSTAPARSASSPRSRSRSAATAPARGLSADGKLYTCLFAVRGHDLRAILRSDAPDDLDESIRARLGAPRRPLLGDPHRADTRPSAGSRCRTSAAERYAVGSAAGGVAVPPLVNSPRPGARLGRPGAQDDRHRHEHRRAGDRHLRR